MSTRQKAAAVANKLHGPTVRLRGEERTCRFRVEAWAGLEEAPILLAATDGVDAKEAWTRLIFLLGRKK